MPTQASCNENSGSRHVDGTVVGNLHSCHVSDILNSTLTLPIFTALSSLLKGEKNGKIGAKTSEDLFLEKRFFQRKTSEDLF